MASAFSHAVVALALGKARRDWFDWRAVALGVFCSVIPDVDVVGFRFGVAYGDLWGHRGLTHSLLFAVLLSGIFAGVFYWRGPRALTAGIYVYLFVCTASHGLLDAMTDGGLGVAFFSPFDTSRYFFPVRPIAVSPIGVRGFFTERGVRVLASEAEWTWAPSLILLVCIRAWFRNGRSRGE